MNFIAMEYIEGVTLRDKIHREHVELLKLSRVLQHIADGLAKAHVAIDVGPLQFATQCFQFNRHIFDRLIPLTCILGQTASPASPRPSIKRKLAQFQRRVPRVPRERPRLMVLRPQSHFL